MNFVRNHCKCRASGDNTFTVRIYIICVQYLIFKSNLVSMTAFTYKLV